jgi:hypothetical protein
METPTQSMKTIRLKADGTSYTAAAGTSNINTEVVDCAGYDGVRLKIAFGTITAGAATSIKAQQGQISSLSDAADLEGTAQTVADTDDNKVFVIDIFRPRERYVRAAILRATQNSVVDYVEAELYGPRVKPVTQDATIGGNEIFNSPAEGTA